MVLHHVAIICSSEESVKFYEKFGFTEFYRKQRNYDTVVLMGGQGIQLEIFVDPHHPKSTTDPETIGLRHMAFKVNDFDKAVVDFECGPVMTDWVGERYCMTKDPDGLPIELHE